MTLAEADVMRFVKPDKGDFVGREVIVTSSRSGRLPWICVYLGIEPDGVSDGHDGEAVLMGGEVVGSISSIAYGHSVGKILAFAYVKPRASEPGTALDVVIMGEARRAEVLAAPAFDPEHRLPRTDAPAVEAAE